MADPEVVKLQAQLHKLQGQLNDVLKERDALNKGKKPQPVCDSPSSSSAAAASPAAVHRARASTPPPHPPPFLVFLCAQSSGK